MTPRTALEAALCALDGLHTSAMLGPNPLASALCMDARAELATLRASLESWQYLAESREVALRESAKDLDRLNNLAAALMENRRDLQKLRSHMLRTVVAARSHADNPTLVHETLDSLTDTLAESRW